MFGLILISSLMVSPVYSEESARCIEESTEKSFTDAAIKCALPSAGKGEAGNESLFSTNASPLDEDTPVKHVEIAGDKNLTASRPWRAPDYTGQEKALGYNADAFSVPKGMEKQVQFWIDIYTKYETDQGVIHDAENVDLVYEVVDFRDIVSNGAFTEYAKEKLKQRRVDDIKKKYMAMLDKFKSVKSIDELSNEKEKKIWKYFETITETNKFHEAAQKNRMRFQLGQKDRMQSAIFFSGRYLEAMEKIFKDNNLPIELTRLAFVESSFNVLARSKVGASGLWQIMPYSARPYRMISAAVDNRNSPMEATKFAARMLRDNYRMLDAWPLAVTGYNHGPAGVRRLTESYKTRNLADLVDNVRSKKNFGFASRNFFASFLAALEVEKNANKYFDKVTWSQPLKAQALKLPVSVSYKEMLAWFDNNDEKAQVFNPHLTKQVRKNGRAIPEHTLVMVPQEKYSQVLASLAKPHREVALAKAEAKGEAGAERTYRVARGDTLIGIAKDFGVKIQDILAHNDLPSASKILPGQVLRIPQ